MSTNYYLYCNQCRKRVLVERGGSFSGVDRFLLCHTEHQLRLWSEHIDVIDVDDAGREWWAHEYRSDDEHETKEE